MKSVDVDEGMIGIFVPEGCPRDKTDCSPLARLMANPTDFICVGRNDPSSRKFPGDEFRLCEHHDHYKTTSNNDYRDLVNLVSVIMQGLSVAINVDWNTEEPMPDFIAQNANADAQDEDEFEYWHVDIDTTKVALERFSRALLQTGSGLECGRYSRLLPSEDFGRGVSALVVVRIPKGKVAEFERLAKPIVVKRPPEIQLV